MSKKILGEASAKPVPSQNQRVHELGHNLSTTDQEEGNQQNYCSLPTAFLKASDDLPLSGNFCIFRVLRTLFLLNKPKKSQYPGTQCQHTREYYHSVEHANGRQNEERDAQVHAYKFNLVEKQRRYAERRRHTALEYGWVGLLHYGRQPLLWSTRC
mmetsp:Transcript_82723/g.159869  ORF Transcript_82723/g.159869 Transcript_82723/m.159869 type:complete len:156 (+) Transcript_82723:335-802(+)